MEIKKKGIDYREGGGVGKMKRNKKEEMRLMKRGKCNIRYI